MGKNLVNTLNNVLLVMCWYNQFIMVSYAMEFLPPLIMLGKLEQVEPTSRTNLK